MIIEVEKNILLRDYLQELPISKAMVKRIKIRVIFLLMEKVKRYATFFKKEIN